MMQSRGQKRRYIVSQRYYHNVDTCDGLLQAGTHDALPFSSFFHNSTVSEVEEVMNLVTLKVFNDCETKAGVTKIKETFERGYST